MRSSPARPWLAAVALVSVPAHAAIVYVDFASHPSSAIPFNIDGVYLNVVTGQTGASAAAVPGWDINPYFTGSTSSDPALTFFSVTTGDLARALVLDLGVNGPNLPNGYFIGPGSPFATGIIDGRPFHAAGGFLGFRFTNEATGQVNYGWALFSSTGSSPLTAGSIRLLSFAYEDSGSGLAVGFVPEPTTPMLLGLAALGAIGIRAWRRKTPARSSS